MAAPADEAVTVPRALRATVLALVVLTMAAAGVATLPDFLSGYLFTLSWTQYGDVIGATTVAALRVWTFWGLFAAILGALLLRLDDGMDAIDAILAGSLGVWVIAFFAGNALGPLGLMNRWTVWGIVVLCGVLLAAAGLPRRRSLRPSPGQWLALLTLGLVGPGLLVLQLGAPIAPFMDILATPASAQRVLTFATYQPLDGDPYGYWDAGSQCPAAELLYGFLSIGSGVRLATLGQTAAIVPLAALLILAVYRLGRTTGDDLSGGFATLLLTASVLFRVLPYSHGRAITYVLVAAGLAWFVEAESSRVRRALAGLVLGTAVGSHAVVGALAMAVAACTVVFCALDYGSRKTAALIGVLAGASLFALPEVAAGTRAALPYPVLPATQLVGAALVAACSGVAAAPTVHARWIPRLLRWALAVVLLWGWIRTPPLLGGMQDLQRRAPVLFVGAGVGVATMLWLDRRRPSPVALAPVAIAIAVSAVAEKISAEWWQTFADPRVRIAVQGFFRKVDYWYQFIWVVPAAVPFALLARATSTGLAVAALLGVLFWPRAPDQNPNYYGQSLPELWAQQAALAKGGYWGSAGHRRWAQTPAELALARVLMEEVEAGRVTFGTHVVHVEPYFLLYEDVVLFSVYTGINDDTYIVGDWEPDISNVGGRIFPQRELPAALAKRPPYVVIHDRTRNNRSLPPEGHRMLQAAVADYEEIFADDGVRLLRRPDLRPQS